MGKCRYNSGRQTAGQLIVFLCSITRRQLMRVFRSAKRLKLHARTAWLASPTEKHIAASCASGHLALLITFLCNSNWKIELDPMYRRCKHACWAFERYDVLPTQGHPASTVQSDRRYIVASPRLHAGCTGTGHMLALGHLRTLQTCAMDPSSDDSDDRKDADGGHDERSSNASCSLAQRTWFTGPGSPGP